MGDPALDLAHVTPTSSSARGRRRARAASSSRSLRAAGGRPFAELRWPPFAAYTWLKIAKQLGAGRGPMRAPGARRTPALAGSCGGGRVPGRVMYLVRSWPRLSQTFVVNEVLAQERPGTTWSSTACALRRADRPAGGRAVRAAVHYLDERVPARWRRPPRPRARRALAPRRLRHARSPPCSGRTSRAWYATCSTLGCFDRCRRVAAAIHRIAAPRPADRAPPRPLRPRSRARRAADGPAHRGALQHHGARPRPVPDPGLEPERARVDAATVVTCCAANVDYLRRLCRPTALPGRSSTTGSTSTGSPRRRGPAGTVPGRDRPSGASSRRRDTPTCCAPAHAPEGRRTFSSGCGSSGTGRCAGELSALRDELGLRDEVGSPASPPGGDPRATDGPTSSPSPRGHRRRRPGRVPNVIVGGHGVGAAGRDDVGRRDHGDGRARPQRPGRHPARRRDAQPGT